MRWREASVAFFIWRRSPRSPVPSPIRTAPPRSISAARWRCSRRRSAPARAASCSRASAAIYGDAGDGPIREDRPANPLSPYGRQKWESERVCAAFARERSLKTVALRFFNVYGPRQQPDSDYSGVVSIFIEHALRGRAPVIYGDGEQTRDFVHVGDVVAALMAAAERPAAAGAALNIGTGSATSVNRIWSEIARIAGSQLVARHAPPRAGDTRHSLADPARAASLLGWRARVAFPDGLARLLAERGFAGRSALSGAPRLG